MADPNSQPALDPTDTEPLRGVGIITAAVSAAVGLAIAFGAPISPDSRVAIATAVGPVSALVVWLWGRRKVFSPATVHAMITKGGGTQ
jgi:hypothetical protein